MVGSIGPGAVAALVAQQLHVALPRELVMLDEPITDFGEFKVRTRRGRPERVGARRRRRERRAAGLRAAPARAPSPAGPPPGPPAAPASERRPPCPPHATPRCRSTWRAPMAGRSSSSWRSSRCGACEAARVRRRM
jgi:hypothetical protein